MGLFMGDSLQLLKVSSKLIEPIKFVMYRFCFFYLYLSFIPDYYHISCIINLLTTKNRRQLVSQTIRWTSLENFLKDSKIQNLLSTYFVIYELYGIFILDFICGT